MGNSIQEPGALDTEEETLADGAAEPGQVRGVSDVDVEGDVEGDVAGDEDLVLPDEPDAADDDDVVEVPLASGKDAGLPEHRELSDEERAYYRGLLEAVLFLASEPLSLNVLAKKIEVDRSNTRSLVDGLADDYAERDGGILLREIAGGYQFITSDRYSEDLKSLFREQKRESLTRSTLETLAIIAYRQPITLPEIDEIRGAASRNLVTTLMARKLVKSQGYRPVPGRPTLYVTTRQFLEHLALGSLADLPVLEDIKELKFDEID